MRPQRGATLLELMVAVVVASLLASIAVPTFNSAVQRARVTRAVADLGAMTLQIDHWQARTFSYPATLTEVGLAGRVDPWGNPYEYLPIAGANTGKVRRDRNLRPINSDYDLYSMGSDGETTTQLQGRKAHDDVVRASDGQFLGLAKDY